MTTDRGRLLTLRHVIERVSMTRSTIYRKISAGTFPAPVKIDGTMARWWEHDIEAWEYWIATMSPPRFKPGTEPGIEPGEGEKVA